MRLVDRTRSLVAHTLSGLAIALGITALAAPSSAHYAFYFTVHGNGSQVVPPSGSTGTVDGQLVFDGITYIITYDITVAGLQGVETDAQVCGYANPGSNAPYIFSLPTSRHITGTYQSNSSDLASWLTNQAYLSIVSSTFPGGEVRAQILFTDVPPEVDYCLGEGSAPCPCGNNASFNTLSGCRNSLGYGSILRAHNIASVTCDTLKMHILLAPTTASVLFFHGTTEVNGGIGVPFGDGLRCVGGNIVRLGIKTCMSGQTFYPDVGDTPITVLTGVNSPGYVSYFQAWYRNVAVFCTPSGFNLTNGCAVTWVP